MSQRFSEYADEIVVLKEKLIGSEEEVTKLKKELEDAEAKAASVKTAELPPVKSRVPRRGAVSPAASTPAASATEDRTPFEIIVAPSAP